MKKFVMGFFGAILVLFISVNVDFAKGPNKITIEVPNDFATIQEAVDAAQSGDEIVVAGSYVGAGALIEDKSLTLVGGNALINEGTLYRDHWYFGKLYAGFIVRGPDASGTSISKFQIQDVDLPVYVEKASPDVETPVGLPTIDDVSISHNIILGPLNGPVAYQAITLRGTKRAVVSFNRIDYASPFGILASGTSGWGGEAVTIKHNVVDFSQYLLPMRDGITVVAQSGAVITHNTVKVPFGGGEAIYIGRPVGDEPQIVSYNDLRGSAWDYFDTESWSYWPGPFTPMYPVIYERNFSDVGCFPTNNRGIGVPQNTKKGKLPEIL